MAKDPGVGVVAFRGVFARGVVGCMPGVGVDDAKVTVFVALPPAIGVGVIARNIPAEDDDGCW